MTLYTRTGDAGETGLFDGSRVRKDHPRVEAYGHLDELAALLGVARASGVDDEIAGVIVQLQRDLFAVGSRLADPAGRVASRVTKAFISADDVRRLEEWIDRFDAQVPALRHFILAGGSPAGASLHLARTVCRRAERHIVALGDEVVPDVLAYVNRLSDLLFVLARVVNARAGLPETEW